MSRILFFNQAELDQFQKTRIIDEYKDTKYIVTGNWGNVGNKICIYSIRNETLAKIEQVTNGNNPKFNLFYKDQFIGSSVLNTSLIHSFIYINGVNWIVLGNNQSDKFIIQRSIHQIAKISPVSFSNNSVYQITSNKISQEPLIIAIVTIIQHQIKQPNLSAI